jgi:hypothetical protein
MTVTTLHPPAPTPAAEPLLPGWGKLKYRITPRRPASAGSVRGRETWGMTYRDPHRSPAAPLRTESTGKATQAAALVEARRRAGELDQLAGDIERGLRQPDYLTRAHVERDPKSTRRTIREAVSAMASTQRSNSSARHAEDFGESFAAYAERLDVEYVDQITEALLLGWVRSVIMTPSQTSKSGGARWYSTIDLWNRKLKAILRRALKHAPQLNSDVLRRGLPRLKAQTDLLDVFDKLDDVARVWLLAARPRSEGGRAQSQDRLARLMRAALRYDIAQLRALAAIERPTAANIAACQLASVDVSALLVGGFRNAEYTALACGSVELGRREAMDRRARVDVVHVLNGKGQRPREVALTGYTEIGRELIRLQIARRDAAEPVSEHSYKRLEELLRVDLPKFGAPRLSPKDLRSTGCNYGRRLHHVQPETRAARWGHSLATHQTYYLEMTGTALQPCATLEESMALTDMMRRAVRLLQLRTARYGVIARAAHAPVSVARKRVAAAPAVKPKRQRKARLKLVASDSQTAA